MLRTVPRRAELVELSARGGWAGVCWDAGSRFGSLMGMVYSLLWHMTVRSVIDAFQDWPDSAGTL